MKDRDPSKPFSADELKSIRLAIDHLHEFAAGHAFVDRALLRGLADSNRWLARFLETARIVYLDGLYPADRKTGLIPILRLVRCDNLADEIASVLSRAVGGSTVQQILRVYRDKAIAHPQFTAAALQPLVDHAQKDMASPEGIQALEDGVQILTDKTAELYPWFERIYPELVNDANSIN